VYVTTKTVPLKIKIKLELTLFEFVTLAIHHSAIVSISRTITKEAAKPHADRMILSGRNTV